MAKYRIDSLAELARQMTFTPQEARDAQVAAAEGLLHSIDPSRAYPLEFVIYRITGFHRRTVSEDLLTGLALQHDLGLLIEAVSDTLDQESAAVSEPVLDIEDVSERFNVTSKTIQRWRRKGLAARRFIFPDGKRRVGFLISSVERFFADHRDQVARGMNFSQMTDGERYQILAGARRLAVSCCPQEIARRIARKLNRSPSTILHTLRKHDAEHPAVAIFPLACSPVSDEVRARILKGYRKGISIRSIARRVGQSSAAVYRAILDERLARLARRKIKFIDDPLYHQEDAGHAIETIVSQDELRLGSNREEARVPRDLPPYLQDLYRTPLLTPASERSLFLKFNYHKFQFVQARRRLEPQFARSRDIDEMEVHLRHATAVKNSIVQANLRLVVSVGRKHLRSGVSLMELISDGNITLMRAVEGFDTHRGHRFSTYATLALMKGFARSVPQLRASRKGTGILDEQLLAAVPDHRPQTSRQQMFDREQVRDLLSRLDDRERSVLLSHYGLGGRGEEPATYEQVGEQLGLSKQRVRQIEQTALAKLRTLA